MLEPGTPAFNEALDRHITGNYGEDRIYSKCEDCVREGCTYYPSDCDGPYDAPADWMNDEED